MSTLRLVFLITGITCLSAWLVQRIELVYGGPYLAGSTTSPEQIFVAIPLAVLALAALAGRWMDRGERAVLYAALVIGVSATASGFMHRFLPGLVTGFYGGFASPTGTYYRFLKVVPEWMVPGGPGAQAAVGAFEGGSAVPWQDWLVPLTCWSLFFLMLFFTSLCLVWIFRRRWLETERLGFPLLEMPLGLLSDQLYRNRAFWWGMVVPLVLFGVNGLHHYVPSAPELPTVVNLSRSFTAAPWASLRAWPARVLLVFPCVIGVGYLLPLEVSFSFWFFFLAFKAQYVLIDATSLPIRAWTCATASSGLGMRPLCITSTLGRPLWQRPRLPTTTLPNAHGASFWPATTCCNPLCQATPSLRHGIRSMKKDQSCPPIREIPLETGQSSGSEGRSHPTRAGSRYLALCIWWKAT